MRRETLLTVFDNKVRSVDWFTINVECYYGVVGFVVVADGFGPKTVVEGK
jgi:hypothetical protein